MRIVPLADDLLVTRWERTPAKSISLFPVLVALVEDRREMRREHFANVGLILVVTSNDARNDKAWDTIAGHLRYVIVRQVIKCLDEVESYGMVDLAV